MHVTCVAEVKGLEFDYVIVPDASPATYPDQPEARRALYVALTRAVHSVTIGAVGRLSAIFAALEATIGARDHRVQGGFRRSFASSNRRRHHAG
jgi:superfamily I DNA/RNA helicase